MLLLDVLGQRWTLRILWELRDGACTFRDLRARCDEVSPTLLNQRLKRLRELHLVHLGDSGFELTPDGTTLSKHLLNLFAWAETWSHAHGLADRASGDPSSPDELT